MIITSLWRHNTLDVNKPCSSKQYDYNNILGKCYLSPLPFSALKMLNEVGSRWVNKSLPRLQTKTKLTLDIRYLAKLLFFKLIYALKTWDSYPRDICAFLYLSRAWKTIQKCIFLPTCKSEKSDKNHEKSQKSDKKISGLLKVWKSRTLFSKWFAPRVRLYHWWYLCDWASCGYPLQL